MKRNIRKNDGITLVALVVTIIVLLILAAITINTVIGHNGLFDRTLGAKEEHRAGAVQEQRDMWMMDKETDNYTGSSSAESLATLLNRLGPNGEKLLTADEIDEINSTGQVTIASRTIVFIEKDTIAKAYDSGNIKIGDSFAYSANGVTDWIVFGKDNDGNILLTTSTPVGSFAPTYTKEHWFTYEGELDRACSDYSTVVQGKYIKARSIRIEDINRVTGYSEPSSTTYTFGTTQNYASGQVDYYYPDEATHTFVKATSNSSVPTREFANKTYNYNASGCTNQDNWQYVNIDAANMQYYVASRAISVSSSGANFCLSYVGGSVSFGSGVFCATNSSGVTNAGGPPAWKIRPVVVIPSSIEVEESEPGKYAMKNTTPSGGGNAVLKADGVDLSLVSDISMMYGKETDYTSSNHPNIDWQLFYSDNSYYYVIASDYVPNAELPCNGNTGFGSTDLVKGESSYDAAFSTGSQNDGVLTAGTIYRDGSASTAFTATDGSRYLSTNYLKWRTAYPSGNNINICATAYMMDTNKWQSFADGASGAFAIGGPTAELFSLSWNAVPDHLKITDLSTSSNNYTQNGYNPGSTTGRFGSTTSMWIITDWQKAYAYWLASPSFSSYQHMLVAHRDGIIDSQYLNMTQRGFRPVVAIPK